MTSDQSSLNIHDEIKDFGMEDSLNHGESVSDNLIHATFLTLELFVSDTQKDALIDQPSIRKTLLTLFSHPQIHEIFPYLPDFLSLEIYFLSRQKMQMWHKKYFGDQRLTDCMTFPLNELGQSPLFVGMVCICPYVAAKEAAERKISTDQELTLYLIHTLLHLFGYTDTTSAGRKKMRLAEKRCFDFLNTISLNAISLKNISLNTVCVKTTPPQNTSSEDLDRE